MFLFLIRHGRTAWNAQGRFQGCRDVPLDETGRAQAKAMALQAERIPFSAVWSSPLSRARETAGFLARRKGLGVNMHEALSEIRHGKWEGLKADTVARRWPSAYRLWQERPQEVVMPGGESLGDVQARALAAIEDVSCCGDGCVAVVSHDAVIKVLLCAWLGLPLSGFRRFDLANASITGVRLNGDGAFLFLLGDISWSDAPYRREVQVSL
ncbi:MAG: histidine phosphatase family protein [Thermovirgaceae bacterium]